MISEAELNELLLDELADTLSCESSPALLEISLKNLTTPDSSYTNLEKFLEKTSETLEEISYIHIGQNPMFLAHIQALSDLSKALFQLLSLRSIKEINQQLSNIIKKQDVLEQSLKQDKTHTYLALNPSRTLILKKLHELSSMAKQLAVNIFDAILLTEIVKRAETIYVQTRSRLTLKPHLPFWGEALPEIITRLFFNAHADVTTTPSFSTHTHKTSAARALSQDSADHQTETLDALKMHSSILSLSSDDFAKSLSEKFILKIQDILAISELTAKMEGTFVEYFSDTRDPIQAVNPLTRLLGGQCVGLIFSQAFTLRTRIPTKPAEMDRSLKRYLDCLEYFNKEQLPPTLFIVYALWGHDILNKDIFMYHLYFKQQFTKKKIVNISFSPFPCEGKYVAVAALELLEEKEKTKTHSVAIVEIILETSDPASKSPHAIQIAKISPNNGITFYQFTDSYRGNFEFRHEGDLLNWLQEYFKLSGYPTHFKTFSLQRTDHIIDRLRPENITRKNPLQGLDEFLSHHSTPMPQIIPRNKPMVIPENAMSRPPAHYQSLQEAPLTRVAIGSKSVAALIPLESTKAKTPIAHQFALHSQHALRDINKNNQSFANNNSTPTSEEEKEVKPKTKKPISSLRTPFVFS